MPKAATERREAGKQSEGEKGGCLLDTEEGEEATVWDSAEFSFCCFDL